MWALRARGSQVSRTITHFAADITTRFFKFAMHMDQSKAVRRRNFFQGSPVQIIYVLRYQQQVPFPFRRQASQCMVRCVGLNFGQLAPTRVIKLLHKFRVSGIRLGRCHIFHAMVAP